MKAIGLIGGMSWESTVTYYQVINRTVAERLGGLHSARIVLYSVDFDEIERCQSLGDWGRSAEILAEAACALERAGADMILICTNTMHKVAGEVAALGVVVADDLEGAGGVVAFAEGEGRGGVVAHQDAHGEGLAQDVAAGFDGQADGDGRKALGRLAVGGQGQEGNKREEEAGQGAH